MNGEPALTPIGSSERRASMSRSKGVEDDLLRREAGFEGAARLARRRASTEHRRRAGRKERRVRVRLLCVAHDVNSG
jgi:hypothetical protein